MVFLRSISLKDGELPCRFPFNVKCIRSMRTIQFRSPVTFFVGENGAGKSTLLEAVASGLEAVAIGSADIERDSTLAAAREFSSHLRFVRNRKPKNCMFFRAEDAFGFTKRMIQTSDDLKDIEKQFEEIKGSGRDRAIGSVRGQLRALAERYGEDPDAKSHGESFLNILESRLRRDSLFFLDEPETPLSPLRQLALMSLIKRFVEQGSQFVIATHSPILMAFPSAEILFFGGGDIEKIEYDDIEHVSITRSFLNNPQMYLRQL